MTRPIQAQLLPTHTPRLFHVAVQRAAELLRAGEVVALPTETVYGLAANALDSQAVKRIFQIKGRPAHNPIIVHVASLEMARHCVTSWPPLAEQLAKAFWPGPLTMVLPRAKEIPAVVTAGGATVGLRWPNHPFIQAVIRECGFPLAAPSANASSELSPTTAEHVRKSLADRISLIVDGGPSSVGIESTVLDLSVSPPRILRPGMIHEQALRAVVGETARTGGRSEPVLKSPGQLPKHYAPKARLVVLTWRDDRDLREQVAVQRPTPGSRASSLSACHVLAYSNVPSAAGFGRVSVLPREAQAFARALYAELHGCDEAGAELIVVEAPPETIEWRAIADRLKRAAMQ